MKHLRITLILVFGLMAAPATVTVMASDINSGDFSSGLTAFIRGDHATALRIWGPLAERGNPDAQFHMGHMFQTGSGVNESQIEAFRWYSLAASKGHAIASYKVKHWETEKRKVAHAAF